MTEYELTEEELAACRWQYGKYVDFFRALWEAIHRADTQNLSQLSLAFPVEVSAYQKYIHEHGWWERAQKKWEARFEVDQIKNTTRDQIPLLPEMRTEVGKEFLSHRLREVQ
jgi:hypothetical protein